MKIYVPTIQRGPDLKTTYMLKNMGREHFVVAPTGEHRSDELLLWCPEKGIRATRNWILDFHRDNFPNDPKLVMLDDDLEFWERNSEGTKFFRTDDISLMLHNIQVMLDEYAHGGVCEKYMSQTRPRTASFNGRYYHLLAYNTSLWPHEFRARVEVGEDHDINLQLLTAGRSNFIITEWANADRPYASGGCSTWRTTDLELREANKLSTLFPGLVKVVQIPGRPCKIQIAWKKAAKQGGI